MKKRLFTLLLVVVLTLGISTAAYAATGTFDFQLRVAAPGRTGISSAVVKKDACGYFVLTITQTTLEGTQVATMYVRDKNGSRVTDIFYARPNNTPRSGIQRDYIKTPDYGSNYPYRLYGYLNKDRADGDYTQVKGRWTP